MVTKISASLQLRIIWILTKFEGCSSKIGPATPVRSFLHFWQEIQILSTYDLDFLQIADFNPIPPRLFSNLFPLGGGRHVSHPVELDTKIFLHQNFSLSGLRVSIADFGFEGPGFDSH